MFVPGHNLDYLVKAVRSNADALLPDIEDSVQPTSNKAIARRMVGDMASSGKFGRKLVFPRINDRESGELLKDVNELTVPGIHGFVYPKAKSAEDIYFIDKLLEAVEYEKGLEIGRFQLIPIIETASAVLNALEICKASKRVIAIAYGCEDFIADLDGIHDEDSQSLFVPRALIAMAARASDIAPIDTVHVRVHDLNDLKRNLALSKKMGFEGMLVLNPKEIELVHQYYSPTPEEVHEAKETLRLWESGKEEGKGVAINDGKFIGPPFVLKARKIIKRNTLVEEVRLCG